MSVQELDRVGVLARVKSGALTVKQASTLLGVSYRQAKRLWARYRRRGPRGLRHGLAGRPSNRARPAAERRRVLQVVRRKYSGAVEDRFGPTLAAEHLAEEDQLRVHPETLRRWMLAAGLWSRVRDAPAHRTRRERKAHFGELVQLDGSFHAWWPSEHRPCLMNMVDDATGTSLLRFEAEETTWAAVTVLRQWIERYGVPLALYTDLKNVYLREATEAERAAGRVPLTQFGRMCAALRIRIIGARSPQAKGRVERHHGTHQDRLVKKLRRLGIQTAAAANAYLEATYTGAHNARFAQPAAAPEDFHRAAPSRAALDGIFRLEATRTVDRHWVVRHDNQYFQITRQSGYPPARSRVLVCEAPDGTVEIWYRDRRVAYERLATPPRRPSPPPAAPAPPRPVSRPSASHPWRRGLDGLRDVPIWQAAQQ
jgi:transposase